MRRWRRRPIWLCGALLFVGCAACAGRDLGALRGRSLPEVVRGVDDKAVHELRRAWLMAQAGTAAVEQVVLLARTGDGRYEAILQPHTNRHGSGAFPVSPDTAAVFHTHPNGALPAPSSDDRRLADRTGIPVFTMSNQGLFLYNPTTRKISKIMDRLDWLQPASWRRLGGAAR